MRQQGRDVKGNLIIDKKTGLPIGPQPPSRPEWDRSRRPSPFEPPPDFVPPPIAIKPASPEEAERVLRADDARRKAEQKAGETAPPPLPALPARPHLGVTPERLEELGREDDARRAREAEAQKRHSSILEDTTRKLVAFSEALPDEGGFRILKAAIGGLGEEGGVAEAVRVAFGEREEDIAGDIDFGMEHGKPRYYREEDEGLPIIKAAGSEADRFRPPTIRGETPRTGERTTREIPDWAKTAAGTIPAWTGALVPGAGLIEAAEAYQEGEYWKALAIAALEAAGPVKGVVKGGGKLAMRGLSALETINKIKSTTDVLAAAGVLGPTAAHGNVAEGAFYGPGSRARGVQAERAVPVPEVPVSGSGDPGQGTSGGERQQYGSSMDVRYLKAGYTPSGQGYYGGGGGGGGGGLGAGPGAGTGYGGGTGIAAPAEGGDGKVSQTGQGSPQSASRAGWP